MKPAKIKRRTFLKFMGGLGALSITGLLNTGCSKDTPPKKFPEVEKYGGQKPEAYIDTKTGKVQIEDSIIVRHSACLGCYSSCGNRVKIDRETGKILRVYGNPYNPNNAEPHLSLDEPLTESFLAFSTYKDKGNIHRGTLCARGNGTLDAHYDPMRILVPLKRNSARGEGKWRPITWDEAIDEIVEGGKLFADIGENRDIEGLRDIRDIQTPIDPKRPELGSKSNQLVFFGGRGDGRTVFAGRFMNSFGSVNQYGHAYT